MSSITATSQAVVRSPFVWGGFGCLAFYALCGSSTLNHPLFNRYFESHPVEYITAGLFFLGVAALILRSLDVLAQLSLHGKDILEPVPEGGNRTDDALRLIAQVKRTMEPIRNGYLGKRLTAALDYVNRKRNAENLDAHLQRLAEDDAFRMHGKYALVRQSLWAMPMLGFFGTVIGITMAIARLSPESLEDASSLDVVTSALATAFDTTALALALSITLMFAKFFVEGMETRLLARVDERAMRELIGRFQEAGTSSDPHVATVKRMAETLLNSCEQLVTRQAEVWEHTIGVAHDRWSELTTSAGELLQASLSDGLAHAMERHAHLLESAVGKQVDGLAQCVSSTQELAITLSNKLETDVDNSLEKMRQSITTASAEHSERTSEALDKHVAAWTKTSEDLAAQHGEQLAELQIALVEASAAAVEHQEQLVRQGDVLLKVVEASGQIKELETSLNENLAALAGAEHFSETVTSLAAAVQLLSARLGDSKSRSAIRLDAVANDSVAQQSDAA